MLRDIGEGLSPVKPSTKDGPDMTIDLEEERGNKLIKRRQSSKQWRYKDWQIRLDHQGLNKADKYKLLKTKKEYSFLHFVAG